MAIGRTHVPKRELIDLVIRHIEDNHIREILKIQNETNLRKRMEYFSKDKLLTVIQSTENGRLALEEAKANYPISTSPTLYLVSKSSWPPFPDLFRITTELAEEGKNGALINSLDHTIKSVYLVTPARQDIFQFPFQEIPLLYEKRIEYINADPESDEYGEVVMVYSLERAFIWYNTNFNHALLLCKDYQAVKPIIHYCSTKLKINLVLPHLSENMLNRLTQGALPRTTSFSRIDDITDSIFDAQTYTISDPSLGELRSYTTLSEDSSRQKTSGFYINHPSLLFGGLVVYGCRHA